MVGVGYDLVLQAAGDGPEHVRAREQHAAQSRLDCYRRYCADVPDDAQPSLTRTHRARLGTDGRCAALAHAA